MIWPEFSVITGFDCVRSELGEIQSRKFCRQLSGQRVRALDLEIFEVVGSQDLDLREGQEGFQSLFSCLLGMETDGIERPLGFEEPPRRGQVTLRLGEPGSGM